MAMCLLRSMVLTLGSGKTVVLDDQWTVTTVDGSRAHTGSTP